VISGIQSAHTGPNGLVVKYFPNIISRFVTAGYGTLMLTLALGIYRRRVLAWRAGLGLIAGSWVYSVVEILSKDNAQTYHGMAIVFCVASLAVVVVWIRWWYAQRIHFQD
jgi:hypothetical protein